MGVLFCGAQRQAQPSLPWSVSKASELVDLHWVHLVRRGEGEGNRSEVVVAMDGLFIKSGPVGVLNNQKIRPVYLVFSASQSRLEGTGVIK